MPAFTFEKISPPASRGRRHSPLLHDDTARNDPAARARGSVIQVLGRFVEARIRVDDGVDQPPPRKTLPK